MISMDAYNFVSASPPDRTGRHPDTSCAGQVGGAGHLDKNVLLINFGLVEQETFKNRRRLAISVR